MSIGSSLGIALRALSRNKLQTALTTIGMTIGVATVLTMIALGTGAEAAIEQQVRAAGMNLIIVTAGNYKPKTRGRRRRRRRSPGALASRREPPAPSRQPPASSSRHSTLKTIRWRSTIIRRRSQRLGDSEAGLGAAATLTPADADAIRRVRGVQYVSEGIHENVHVTAGDKRWFTRLHGGDVELPSIRRSWTFTSGRFFTAREQSRLAPVVVLGAFVAEKLFGAVNPVGRQILLWKQPFQVVGVVASGSWMMAPAAGDDQFDAVYVPFTTIHRLLNLSKLNDITITAASTGEVTRVAKDVTELLRARHGIGAKSPGRLHGRDAGAAVAVAKAACGRTWRAP